MISMSRSPTTMVVIVIYRVITAKPKVARRFFAQLKADLKRDLRQEEILIVEKDADLL